MSRMTFLELTDPGGSKALVAVEAIDAVLPSEKRGKPRGSVVYLSCGFSVEVTERVSVVRERLLRAFTPETDLTSNPG